MTNAVRVFKIENPLAKVIYLPGGRTVVEALRLADTRIDGLKPQLRAALQVKIVALSYLAADGRSGADPAALDGIYSLADEIIGLSGPIGLKELSEAAYSLCDLADRFRTSGKPNWQAIEVHVGSLLLLSSEERDPGERRRILDGLRKVGSRFVAPVQG